MYIYITCVLWIHGFLLHLIQIVGSPSNLLGRVENELQRGLVFQHGSGHPGHVKEVLPLWREVVDLRG